MVDSDYKRMGFRADIPTRDSRYAKTNPVFEPCFYPIVCLQRAISRMFEGISNLTNNAYFESLNVFLGIAHSESLLFNILLLLVGLALITKGGDLFTDSAINVAHATRIPPSIIGATLVSMATTFPELMVSLTGVMRGSVDLGVGNALGSCCCNIGLIVGSCALINSVIARRRGIHPGIIALRGTIVGPALFMLAGGFSLWAFGASGVMAGTTTHALLAWHGVALVMIMLAYLAYSTIIAIRTRYQSGPMDDEREAIGALHRLATKELFLFSLLPCWYSWAVDSWSQVPPR